MTFGVERDVTRPLCVLFTGRVGGSIMIRHVNLLFLPAYGTVAPLLPLTLCQ